VNVRSKVTSPPSTLETEGEQAAPSNPSTLVVCSLDSFGGGELLLFIVL
jgi:hypothetical protein